MISILPTISELIYEQPELQFEFIANLRSEGLEAGTIFISLPSSDPVVAFNFYTQSQTHRDMVQARLEGTYNHDDYIDTLTDITIKRPIYTIQDISRTIRYWLNKYFSTCVLKPISLLHNDVLITI